MLKVLNKIAGHLDDMGLGGIPLQRISSGTTELLHADDTVICTFFLLVEFIEALYFRTPKRGVGIGVPEPLRLKGLSAVLVIRIVSVNPCFRSFYVSEMLAYNIPIGILRESLVVLIAMFDNDVISINEFFHFKLNEWMILEEANNTEILSSHLFLSYTHLRPPH